MDMMQLELFAVGGIALESKNKACGYGGARTGAGRPQTGRKRVFLYITDEEKKAVKALIDKLRNEEDHEK